MDKQREHKIKLYSNAIYRRIEELAKENNLILGKWAIKAEMTPATIYGLKNSGKIPNTLTIKYLCEAINIELKDFYNVEYLEEIKFLND